MSSQLSTYENRLQSVEQLSAAMMESLNTIMRQNMHSSARHKSLPVTSIIPPAKSAPSSEGSEDDLNSQQSESDASAGPSGAPRRPTLDSRQHSARSFPDSSVGTRLSTGTLSRDGMTHTPEIDAASLALSPTAGMVGTGADIYNRAEPHLSSGQSHDEAKQESTHEDPAVIVAARVKETPVEDALKLPTSFDDETDRLLRMISPHEQQVQFRDAAISMLQNQVRLVLGAVSFDATHTKSHCFLPTDPIQVTVILCQGQIAYWHSAVADRLRALSEHGPEAEFTPGHNTNSITVVTVQENTDDAQRAAMSLVSTVALIHEVSGFKVTCKIGEIDVEISVNNRNALCVVALIDEFNVVVGRDNLFKRSLLLIRAWWLHETATVFNTAMSHFLSDQALLYMVVAVFNLHWHEIRSPLYALYYFLQLYQDYDGKSQAVTAQGIVSFINDGNQPNLMKPEPFHLLDIDWTCKNWQLFNVHDPLNGDIPGGSTTQLPSVSKICLHMLYNTMSKSVQRFERFGFNIVHPFTHLNVLTEKLSSRRLTLLNQIFKTAFTQLQTVLDGTKSVGNTPRLPEGQEKPEGVEGMGSIALFFPAVVQRYSGTWRPDVFGNYLPASFLSVDNLAKMDARQVSIMEYVDYCSFVADSVITESAVLTFCIDLLTWRGPLPTGEVGKLLSEATTIPNLSHKLREKFGGLKKFIERYPSLFVFSNDHPFNPHVLLRKNLSTENLELIDRGIFPVHLISKAARQVGNKKTTLAQPTAATAAATASGSSASSAGVASGSSGSVKAGWNANGLPPTAAGGAQGLPIAVHGSGAAAGGYNSNTRMPPTGAAAAQSKQAAYGAHGAASSMTNGYPPSRYAGDMYANERMYGHQQAPPGGPYHPSMMAGGASGLTKSERERERERAYMYASSGADGRDAGYFPVPGYYGGGAGVRGGHHSMPLPGDRYPDLRGAPASYRGAEYEATYHHRAGAEYGFDGYSGRDASSHLGGDLFGGAYDREPAAAGRSAFDFDMGLSSGASGSGVGGMFASSSAGAVGANRSTLNRDAFPFDPLASSSSSALDTPSNSTVIGTGGGGGFQPFGTSAQFSKYL